MAEEIRELVPDRRHFLATEQNWPELRIELKRYRIGLVPVMLTRQPSALRRAAFKLAPRRFWLTTRASNATTCGSLWHRSCSGAACRSTASVCAPGFGPGQSRPHAWSQGLSRHRRAATPRRGAAACRALSLFPLPALARRRGAHLQPAARNGARVRCRAALLFDTAEEPDATPLLEFCARLALVRKPRYREPRWSRCCPPKVREFNSPGMWWAWRKSAALSVSTWCRWSTRNWRATAATSWWSTTSLRPLRPGGAA